MKKNLILTVLFMAFAGIVYAEDAVYKPTYVEDWAKQGNVVELFFMYHGYSSGIRYERKIDDVISAGVSLNYNFAGDAPSYGARLECFFYPQAHTLSAWFVGPFAGAYNSNAEESGPVFFSLGAQGGYRWIFDYITVTPRAMVQYGLGGGAARKIWNGAAGFIYGAGLSAGVAF